MKKKISIILIIIIFIGLNIINPNISFAGGRTLQSTTINPDDYNPSNNPITTSDSELFLNKVGIILGFIRNISVIVAVICLMLIGVKYILGSAEEKANYKATMLPYIIGCIMAATGTTIVTFIYNSVT